jgi:hypothetical protein|tara:strand:- start:61 stop:375 length:315 start_codon:yes stop_codon:yes gene_type:complete
MKKRKKSSSAISPFNKDWREKVEAVGIVEKSSFYKKLKKEMSRRRSTKAKEDALHFNISAIAFYIATHGNKLSWTKRFFSKCAEHGHLVKKWRGALIKWGKKNK